MKTNVNIENVISERFRLQSVQKNISNYWNIAAPKLETFKDRNFLTKFSTWDYDKQKSLLIDLGGPANYRQTRYWINGLIRDLNKINNQTKEQNEENLRIHT